MRCKQGDMAVITQSRAGESGKEVTCVSFVGQHKNITHHSDVWKVDRPIKWLQEDGSTVERLYVPDSCLMPINPKSDDTDDIAMYLRPVREQNVKQVEEQTL